MKIGIGGRVGRGFKHLVRFFLPSHVLPTQNCGSGPYRQAPYPKWKARDVMSTDKWQWIVIGVLSLLVAMHRVSHLIEALAKQNRQKSHTDVG